MRTVKKYMNLFALLSIVSVATWSIGCADSTSTDDSGSSDAGAAAAPEDGGAADDQAGSSTGSGTEVPE